MLEYKLQIDLNFSVEGICEPLVGQLILDLQIDEMKATDIFFSSATFRQLVNPNNNFYLKSWQDIYEIFKNELVK